MIATKFVFRTSVGLFVGLLVGCPDILRKADTSESSVIRTHNLVSKPPQIEKNKNLLLVSLKPYLGRQPKDGKSSADLRLETAGKPLILRDSKGIIHKASQITLTWSEVSLQEKQKISRKVLGPYASFESAQKISEQLKKIGINALIAHPNDWEVWVSESTEIPKEFEFSIWQEIISTEIKPVLKGRSGEIVLSGPLLIHAPDGLLWQGGVYLGPFWLQEDAYGSWTFVEEVPLERYLRGVVPHEIGPNSPDAALAAQAVLARTWALANNHRFEIDGYHLCSDTQCQVYKDPRKAGLGVIKAIGKTAGKVLKWKGKPINAVYHASNGGVSAAGHEAWAMKPLPYLKTKLDGSAIWRERFSLPLSDHSSVRSLLNFKEGAYGNSHIRFRWKRTLNADVLKKTLALEIPNVTKPKSVKVVERGNSGRVLSLEILSENSDSPPIVLRLDQIRRVLRSLPSTLFVVEQLQQGVWQFVGGGFGHGAGLSQAGAIDLAGKGWTAERILNYYYPGTKYGSFP